MTGAKIDTKLSRRSNTTNPPTPRGSRSPTPNKTSSNCMANKTKKPSSSKLTDIKSVHNLNPPKLSSSSCITSGWPAKYRAISHKIWPQEGLRLWLWISEDMVWVKEKRGTWSLMKPLWKMSKTLSLKSRPCTTIFHCLPLGMELGACWLSTCWNKRRNCHCRDWSLQGLRSAVHREARSSRRSQNFLSK